MGLIYLILVGAVAGYLATRLLKIDADPLTTVLIRIAGALVGGLILQGVLAVLGLLGGIIGALIGAVLVIWLYQVINGRK